MRCNSRWSAALAVAASLPLAIISPAEKPAAKPPPAPAVVYTPGPVAYVAGPGVKSAEWSPDGRYILVVLPSHKPQGPDFRLVLWSRRTHRAVVDWTPPWPDSRITQVVWFAGGHTPIVIIMGVGHGGPPDQGDNIQGLHLVQLDAVKRTAAVRRAADLSPIAWLNASPTQPVMLLQETVNGGARFRLLTPDTIGDPVTPPNGQDGVVWSPDGKTPYFLGFPKGKTTFTKFDLATRQWEDAPKRPALFDPPEPPYYVHRATTPVHNGSGRGALVHPLWIVSGEGDAVVSELLCGDGGGQEISPQGDAVLYETDGIVLFRDVIGQPGAQYLAKQREADIEQAKQNSREIALSLIQYGQDYDRTFPPAEGMHDAVDPMIRDGAVWYGAGGNPGFVYTINGGPFPDNPAETLLGYTPAPGGRWNVFADGHVAWAPDP